MNDYTVILLRPDYVTGDFGQDTYMTWVNADTVDEAVVLAQLKAAAADCIDLGDFDDYFVIAVFAGQHDDIKP